MKAHPPPADLAEIRRALTLLLEPGAVAELRVPNTARDGTVSGYYSDPDALTSAAAQWAGHAPGVYVTLNPVNRALLARAANRVQPRAKHTTSDGDVLRRRWLPIDLDSVRPPGISATDAEHSAVLARASEMRGFLDGEGWPPLILADSGNGGHLLPRVDLPNDTASAALVKRVLEALALHFTDDAVAVDLTTFNAGRIWKLYGTLAAKGDATPDRPHRLARLLDVPAPVEVVPRESLERLAALAPAPPTTARRWNGYSPGTADLEGWLTGHGLRVGKAKLWNGGTLYELAACPWNPEHVRTARVVRFASGGLSAGCFHHGCAGRRWHDLRELLEPNGHSEPNEAGPRPAAPVLVRLADVKPEPVQWLWLGRIARGKITLVVGDPGQGKSCLTLDVTARVTTGAAWPAGEGRTEPGDVVILTAEDGLADTVRPRVDAAGGDPARVHVLTAVDRGDHEEPFSLARDLPALETTIRQTGARLVILDPINAYFGVDRDSYKDTEVRSLLAPLAALAERLGVAVLAIMHLNKTEQRSALYRVIGSIAFVAAARGALAVVPDPDDADRRLFGVIKSNLARKPPALAFRMVSSDPLAPGAAPRLAWEPHPAEGVDVEALLSARRDRDEDPGDRRDADAILRELLAPGEVPATDVLRAAKANGISRRTLCRAKARLGVRVRHRGQPGTPGAWYWSLPPGEECHAPAEECQPGKSGTLRGTARENERKTGDFSEECHVTADGTLRDPGGTLQPLGEEDWRP